MPNPNTSTAIALIKDPELRVRDAHLAELQAATLAQFQHIKRIRGEETIRGLLAGMMLLRIKESMPGGFVRWVEKDLHQFGRRWVNYLMRLAIVFTAKSRVTKPMMLQLPGDQTELQIESLQGTQRAFMEKALKFCGELSLTELLEKYGIKESKALGGKRERSTEEPAVELSGEDLYLIARDEIGAALERAEMLFVTENRLQHLAGHPEEIRGVVKSLRDLADKVEAAAKPILKS